MIMSQDYYTTSDLPLAAALALEVPMESIDRTNPRRAEFLFADSGHTRAIERDYYRGALNVEPRRYFDQLKAIKARLYAG
jgi:hypothetical protein